ARRLARLLRLLPLPRLPRGKARRPRRPVAGAGRGGDAATCPVDRRQRRAHVRRLLVPPRLAPARLQDGSVAVTVFRLRRLRRPHRLGGDGRAAGRGTPNAPPLPARLQRPRACPRAAPTTRVRGRLRGPDGHSRLPRRRLALRRLPAPGERAAARGPCVRLGGSAGRIHAVWTRSLARRRLADRALLAPCQHRPVRNGALPRSPAATPCLLRSAARRGTTAPAT